MEVVFFFFRLFFYIYVIQSTLLISVVIDVIKTFSHFFITQMLFIFAPVEPEAVYKFYYLR